MFKLHLEINKNSFHLLKSLHANCEHECEMEIPARFLKYPVSNHKGSLLCKLGLNS